MKHSVFHKRSMLELIRDCTDSGDSMPTDPQICERFGFTQEEQARTLLADLADAGAIVITGAARSRVISLRVAKAVPPPITRREPMPAPVRKCDPAVERLTQMIITRRAECPAPTKDTAMPKSPAEKAPSMNDFAAAFAEHGSIDKLFVALMTRVRDAETAAAGAVSVDQLEAMRQRAEAAEGKLASLKAIFA